MNEATSSNKVSSCINLRKVQQLPLKWQLFN